MILILEAGEDARLISKRLHRCVWDQRISVKSEGASMRKFLLASTALVGAFTFVDRADAQQLTTDSPFTVRIDGFANFRGGIVSESNQTNVSAAAGNDVRRAAASIAKAQGRGDDFKTDTEIHITATGKADNGLVYGLYVEIEADPVNTNINAASTANNIAAGQGVATSTTTTGSVNYIDEANIFLQGSWGRIEMGQQDGAGDQLFFGAPYDYGPAYGQGSGADGDALFRWANQAVQIVSPGSGITSAPLYSWNVKALDSSDATKLTYLSPVISGFRAGISFAPDGNQNNGFTTGVLGANRQNITSTSIAATNACTGPGAATCPALPATGAPGFANNYGGYGDFQHWIEV
ncbi:MAG: porin, partial [Alphaproteobacteria bacterium]|nr:porin [Alphaproteobacteria bacterium]